MGDRTRDATPDPPPVPLKTYHWEDLRRSKQEGNYPWTHLNKKPFDHVDCQKEEDHEYEVITPMSSQPAPPPVLKVTDMEVEAKYRVEEEFVPSRGWRAGSYDSEDDHHFLRIPLDDELVIADEEQEDCEEEDEEEDAQALQARLEERFFPQTPKIVELKEKCENKTGEMKPSDIENPSNEKDLKKANEGQGFQQRIRSQAGKLRTKLSNISRPKINLPERPKFHFPERSKKIALPERPKAKQSKAEKSKFSLPHRPKISLPTFNFSRTRSCSLRRPLRDSTQLSTQSNVGSKKNIFDTMKFKTYPRIFSKKKKALTKRAQTPPARIETESMPSTPGSKRGQRWVQKFKDIKFADEDNQCEKKSQLEEDCGMDDNSAPFHDSYLHGAINFDETKQKKITAVSSSSIQSDREQHSSGSSSERHRAGVLEEIDSDEFFLRQKGLSREDVDVSRYLSLEIRDAFRSPKNALARLDTELYDDDIEYEVETQQKNLEEALVREDEPLRPERRRSMKSSILNQPSENINPETQFNTYPPSRPNRPQKKSLVADTQLVGTNDLDKEVNYKKYNASEENMHVTIPCLEITDTSKDVPIIEYIDDDSENKDPPQPPKRRKSLKDVTKDESISSEDWIQEIDEQMMVPEKVRALHEEAESLDMEDEQDIPPTAPGRKHHSRGTSLADEDRTSRGVESLLSEMPDQQDEDFPIENDMKDNFGYAIVEKQIDKPNRPKPPRPPPPSRRKKTASHISSFKSQSFSFLSSVPKSGFFTYPRRAMKTFNKDPPVRPVRNYSTLGPARPPRRNRVFREPVYTEEDSCNNEKNQIKSEFEFESDQNDDKVQEGNDVIEDSVDNKDESRGLKSGEVIEKMKGRPLPPPPRPPRKIKDDTVESDTVITQERNIGGREIVVERFEVQVSQREKSCEPSEQKQGLLGALCDRIFNATSRSKENENNVRQPTPECEIIKQTDIGILKDKTIKRNNELRSQFFTNSNNDEVLKRKQVGDAPMVVESSIATQTDPLPEDFFIEEGQMLDEPFLRTTSNEISTACDSSKTTVERHMDVTPSSANEIQFFKKLQVNELDVEKITVNEVQAKKISVSDIDGVCMQINELSSKSGNLIVSGVELPPSALATFSPLCAHTDSTTSTTQSTPETAASTVQELSLQNQAEVTPKPLQHKSSRHSMPLQCPSIVVQPSSPPVNTTLLLSSGPEYQTPTPAPRTPRARQTPMQEQDSEEDVVSLVQASRRRLLKPRYSTDEDDDDDAGTSSLRQYRPREASTNDLVRQLLLIWQGSLLRSVNQVVDGINIAFPEGEKRRDALTAACIVLVLLAGLIMMGFGQGKTIHTHHWDFQFPSPR